MFSLKFTDKNHATGFALHLNVQHSIFEPCDLGDFFFFLIQWFLALQRPDGIQVKKGMCKSTFTFFITKGTGLYIWTL